MPAPVPAGIPSPIDLDSTVGQTYGRKKDGARDHCYMRSAWLPSLTGGCRRNRPGALCPSAQGPGQHRPRRGALSHRETVSRVRYAGARGQLTMRADSGFYSKRIVATGREHNVRFSITVRQHSSLRQKIEEIAEEDWTPLEYWLDGAADAAEIAYAPFGEFRTAASDRKTGKTHTGVAAGPAGQLLLPRLHHRPQGRDDLPGGRSSPSCRNRERDQGPKVRRRPQPHASGELYRQRRCGWRYRRPPTSSAAGSP